MMMDDNDGQMIFGDLGDLKLPDIYLTGEEKTSPRKLVLNGDRIRPQCKIKNKVGITLLSKINKMKIHLNYQMYPAA